MWHINSSVSAYIITDIAVSNTVCAVSRISITKNCEEKNSEKIPRHKWQMIFEREDFLTSATFDSKPFFQIFFWRFLSADVCYVTHSDIKYFLN